MWRSFSIAFTLIIGYAHSVFASNLDQILRTAIGESPQIKSQIVQTDLTHGDRWRRFFLNEPQFNYTSADDHGSEIFGVSLPVPFPGRIISSVRLDAAKARSQDAELKAKKIEIVRTLTQFYVECASSRESVKLQASILSDNETVARSLKSLYEGGHASQAEKIGAELQVRQARVDLQSSEDKSDVSCAKLEKVLQKSGVNDMVLPVELPDDLSPNLVASLGSEVPDQLRATAAIDSASLNESTAFSSQLPDLLLTYNRNHYLDGQGSPNGRDWTTTYGISLTIPLFFFTKESVEFQRVKAQARSDRNAAEIQQATADSDVEEASREFRRNHKRLAELRNTDLALAEALVESTASAYRAGKLGYAELVLSRKTMNDLRIQDIQLRSGLILARLRCLNQCETTAVTKGNTP